MGPSGYGFLHPSIIGASDPVRQDFINLTQAAAAALDMNAYVHWDDYNNALLASTSNLTEYSVDSGEDYSAVELDGHTTRSLAEIADGLGANAVSKEDPNTLAMEAYLRHFDNTDIQTVFSPVMPYVEDWVGNVAVFRELIRWTDPNTEQSVANQLLALPRGTLGYIYQLPEVDMQSVEKLGGLLQGTNVTLVDHRHLRTVALAKIQHEQ